MEPEPAFARGGRALLVAVSGDQGGIQVDDHPPGKEFPGHRQPGKPGRAAGQQVPDPGADLRPGSTDPLQPGLVEPGQARRTVASDGGSPNTSLDGRAARYRTCSSRRKRSPPPGKPGPCPDPTNSAPRLGAVSDSTRRSDRSGPRIYAAAPHPRDRPDPSHPSRRPAADPTRYPCSPGRCTRFYSGYDLDNHILAVQVHLPFIAPRCDAFSLNSRGRSVSEAPSCTPAASPRLRRRPSPWPPHRQS